MKRIYVLCLIVPILFAACSKDRDPVTRTTFLTYKSWYIQEAKITASVNGQIYTQDLLEFMESCMEDNTTLFKNDGSVWIDEGPTKCNPNDSQQTQAGNWQLVENETKLRGSLPGFPVDVDMDILVLNEKQLKLRLQDTILGIPGIVEINYTHIK